MSLTQIGGSKKKKHVPEETIILEVELKEPTREFYPEFDYTELMKAKTGKDGIEDPFEDNEEHKRLEAMAKKFEEKYGKCKPTDKPKFGKAEDHLDMGIGYDREDSFIDDTEAYDELVPSTLRTEHKGFYINCGKLTFVEAETDDEESEGQPPVSISQTPSTSQTSDAKRKHITISSDEGSDEDTRLSELKKSGMMNITNGSIIQKTKKPSEKPPVPKNAKIIVSPNGSPTKRPVGRPPKNRDVESTGPPQSKKKKTEQHTPPMSKTKSSETLAAQKLKRKSLAQHSKPKKLAPRMEKLTGSTQNPKTTHVDNPSLSKSEADRRLSDIISNVAAAAVPAPPTTPKKTETASMKTALSEFEIANQLSRHLGKGGSVTGNPTADTKLMAMLQQGKLSEYLRNPPLPTNPELEVQKILQSITQAHKQAAPKPVQSPPEEPRRLVGQPPNMPKNKTNSSSASKANKTSSVNHSVVTDLATMPQELLKAQFSFAKLCGSDGTTMNTNKVRLTKDHDLILATISKIFNENGMNQRQRAQVWDQLAAMSGGSKENLKHRLKQHNAKENGKKRELNSNQPIKQSNGTGISLGVSSHNTTPEKNNAHVKPNTTSQETTAQPQANEAQSSKSLTPGTSQNIAKTASHSSAKPESKILSNTYDAKFGGIVTPAVLQRLYEEVSKQNEMSSNPPQSITSIASTVGNGHNVPTSSPKPCPPIGRSSLTGSFPAMNIQQKNPQLNMMDPTRPTNSTLPQSNKEDPRHKLNQVQAKQSRPMAQEPTSTAGINHGKTSTQPEKSKLIQDRQLASQALAGKSMITEMGMRKQQPVQQQAVPPRTHHPHQAIQGNQPLSKQNYNPKPMNQASPSPHGGFFKNNNARTDNPGVSQQSVTQGVKSTAVSSPNFSIPRPSPPTNPAGMFPKSVVTPDQTPGGSRNFPPYFTSTAAVTQKAQNVSTKNQNPIRPGVNSSSGLPPGVFDRNKTHHQVSRNQKTPQMMRNNQMVISPEAARSISGAQNQQSRNNYPVSLPSITQMSREYTHGMYPNQQLHAQLPTIAASHPHSPAASSFLGSSFVQSPDSQRGRASSASEDLYLDALFSIGTGRPPTMASCQYTQPADLTRNIFDQNGHNPQ